MKILPVASLVVAVVCGSKGNKLRIPLSQIKKVSTF